MKPARRRFPWHVWRLPLALALVSAVGLVAGLVGDGAWDTLSWLGLGLPVGVCLWFGLLRRGPPRAAAVADSTP